MESEKKFCYHYHGTFEVKTAEVEIVFEAEDEEVKEIFDDNKNTLSGADGTLLDKSVFSSELSKSCRQA